VAPLTVLTLTLLVGMVAIAIDGGALIEDRRHLQATADAAALAAAADLYAHYPVNGGTDPSGTALKSALATAAANGLSDDGANSVVTVNISPARYQGGPNAGQPLPPGYVEVIVQLNETRKFSNVFAPGTIPVRARAVARGTWKPAPDTVHALTLHNGGAVTVGSFSSLNVNGSLRVNSDSVTAIVVGLGGVISALAMILNALLSGLLGLLLGLLGLGGTPTKYVPPLPDPLRYLQPPDPVALGLANRGSNVTINSGTVDLYPGVYTGSLNVGGNATVNLHTNPDGSPGIYLLKGGGLNVSGSANIGTVAGEPGGIMVFNSWSALSDAININSSGTVTLAPPNTGPYKGLTLFQARGSLLGAGPPISLTGYAGTKITGTVYGAYAACHCHGKDKSCVLGGQHIVDSLSVDGTVNVDPSGQPVANTRQVGLVE
jgi:hypothetical protein